MAMARVTSKGQVTIPQAVREQFDIQQGDDLLFVEEDGCLKVRVVKKRNLTDFYGIFPSTRPYTSFDEIREIVGYEIGRQLSNGGHE